MPRVSVLISTFRPGFVDISLAGMRDQTYQDFEVILVDRRYELRHERVMALAREWGVNLIHVPEHRRNGKWAVIGSAWNTAMAVARGEVIIFLMDATYAPPGWIEAHLLRQNGNAYVVCPYRYTNAPPVRTLIPYDFSGARDKGGSITELDPVHQGLVFDELSAFEQRFEPRMLERLTDYAPPHQDPRVLGDGAGVPDTWIHVKNESMPREKALEMGGLDERLDRGKGPLDLDLGFRLCAAGLGLVWDNGGMARCIDPRWFLSSMPWGDRDRRLEGRWSMYDGLAYNARRRTEAQQGKWKALNPFDLRDLARNLEPWRNGETIDVSRLDVPDEQYFGGTIWPDSP